MAGSTVDRLSAAEHHAERGEVVVDEVTARNLAQDVSIVDWREEEGSE